MTSPEVDPDVRLREGILERCFVKYDGLLAGGQQANNKLDVEVLQAFSELGALAIVRMTVLARPYQPDLIVPVPKGANWLGLGVGQALGTGSVRLSKDPKTREISVPSLAEEVIAQHENIVVVEDVSNTRGSCERLLNLAIFHGRVSAVISVWDRGDPQNQRDIGVPVESIITEHIPEMLSPQDSPYWELLYENRYI